MEAINAVNQYLELLKQKDEIEQQYYIHHIQLYRLVDRRLSSDICVPASLVYSYYLSSLKT